MNCQEFYIKKGTIVAHIHVDSFAVQVYGLTKYPKLRGKPCAAIHEGLRTNFYSRIVLVNYEAKSFGVNRNTIKANEAQSSCPQIKFFVTPMKHNKPYTQEITVASDLILDVVLEFIRNKEKK